MDFCNNAIESFQCTRNGDIKMSGEIIMISKRRLVFKCRLCRPSRAYEEFFMLYEHFIQIHEFHDELNKTFENESRTDQFAIEIETDEQPVMESIFIEDKHLDDEVLWDEQENSYADEETTIRRALVIEALAKSEGVREIIENDKELSNSFVDNNYTEDDDGAYTCNFCQQRFPSPSKIKSHLVKHRTERKYACAICGKRFKDKGNTVAHYRRHTGLKDIQCTECPRQFYTPGQLRQHMQHHRGEPLYMCAECGRSFYTSSQLNFHSKRHSNIRAQQCETCEMKFFDRKSLRKHMLGHLNMRAYSCETCGAKFNRNESLRVHRKLHANLREYICEFCPASFNQKPGLLLHIKRIHGESLENEKRCQEMTIADVLLEDQ